MTRNPLISIAALLILTFSSSSWAEKKASVRPPGSAGKNRVTISRPQDHDVLAQKDGTKEDIWGKEGEEKDIWKEEGKKGQGPGEGLWKEEESKQKESPVEITGKFWNRFGHDINEENSFEDDAFNHTEFRPKIEYRPNRDVDMVFSLDMDLFSYWNSDEGEYRSEVQPYEAYIKYSGRNFEISAGNMFVKWGKADEVSPLDIVNPEDLRDGFVRDRQDRKLPIPMLNLKFFKDKHKLEALFIPYFEESEIDLVRRDWAIFRHLEEEVGNFDITQQDVSNKLRNSEAGIRYSGTIRNLDYAISFFHTRDDLPSLDSMFLPSFLSVGNPSEVTIRDLAKLANLTRQPIRLSFQRQNVAGLEFETTLGDFGLRGDLAYIDKKPLLTNRLIKIEEPLFHYVIGADYNGPANFYANLQFSQQIILGLDDIVLFADRVTTTVNGKISKGIWENKFEVAVRYLYNMPKGDYYVNPIFTVKYWDKITLDFGLELEGGPESSPLGTFDDNDEIYGIFTYKF